MYIFAKQRKKVDKSITLYSFEGPFELLHEDIVNIRLVAKSVVDPRYSVLLIDLFISKITSVKHKPFD